MVGNSAADHVYRITPPSGPNRLPLQEGGGVAAGWLAVPPSALAGGQVRLWSYGRANSTWTWTAVRVASWLAAATARTYPSILGSPDALPGRQKASAMAKLDTEHRDEISRSQFAFPKQRKEPLEDASHVRNAIARFDQVQDVTDEERDAAWKRIKAAAKKHGVEVNEGGWRELGTSHRK